MAIRAEDLRSEVLTQAIRHLRLFAGLTQLELSERTSEFRAPALRRVIPSQISDYERGRKVPSLERFFSILVASSADGRTLELELLQRALYAALNRPAPSSSAQLSQEVSMLRRELSTFLSRIEERDECPAQPKHREELTS